MNRYGILLAGSLFALTGCMKDHTSRLQMEEEAEKSSVRTVGDVAEFQTSGALPVSGIGLVVGLEGTGGGTPPGPYRQMAEDYLKRNKIDNPKEWLDSPNNALVLLSAEIPAGSRRGDRIHVEVTLPPGSKAKSLRGGYLLETSLTPYASSSQVRNHLEQSTDVKPVGTGDTLLKGHVLADAEGPLQGSLKEKNLESKDTADAPDGSVKRAWIWKGARTKSDQPYFLVMNPDQQRYRMAMNVAARINETFHGPGALEKIAAERNADTVVLIIPPQYRGNAPHFMRVIRMIPIDRVDESNSYRRKLEEQLMQPETTLAAGIRLEALGRSSIKVLLDAMKNSPYPLVRFASAESLAYLGEPIAAAELGKLTEAHPSLQAFCLTALSSLDESASSFALQDLLGSENPEIRYGAFRALRELDPRSEVSQGFRMNKNFFMHVASKDSRPLIHLLSGTRAEVVLFGKTPALLPPFSLRAGPDLILTAKVGDKACTISRFSTHKPQRIEQCSLAAVDIIKTMADMGALYSDVAQMLMQARDTKSLNCELALDALPKAVPIKKLAENAHVDKMMENEIELLKSAVPDQVGPASVFDRPSRR
ncbi:MAG: flagellar basal body P-ring protein FlgI [Planctomycetes bacterium]|nr:flagellar basal body P-ring protein FlgI [Planctomycetota bacterium]